MRRTWIAAVVALAGVAAPAAVVVRAQDDPPAEPAGDDESTRAFARVDQRDLARQESFDAAVGRVAQRSLRLQANGTLTWLPTVGQVVSPGQVLAEVDGEPVVLLAGERPAWRTLGPGVSDGEDVRQLEAALLALGYADPSVFTADDEWSSATTRAVRHLQFTLGLAEDGRLDLGELVFAPRAVRIAEVEAQVGDAAAGVELGTSEDGQVVELDARAEDLELLAVGREVDVELATGERLAGRVSAHGAPSVDQTGEVTLPVTVEVADLDGRTDVGDGLPAEVHVAVVEAEGVLAVPVESLLALAEGGYAVEVRDGAQPSGTRLVGVELGVFADGLVEVTPTTGSLAAGDEVVVA